MNSTENHPLVCQSASVLLSHSSFGTSQLLIRWQFVQQCQAPMKQANSQPKLPCRPMWDLPLASVMVGVTSHVSSEHLQCCNRGADTISYAHSDPHLLRPKLHWCTVRVSLCDSCSACTVSSQQDSTPDKQVAIDSTGTHLWKVKHYLQGLRHGRMQMQMYKPAAKQIGKSSLMHSRPQPSNNRKGPCSHAAAT